jgi:hypothetical protein
MRGLPLSSFSSVAPEGATATRGRVQPVYNKVCTKTLVVYGFKACQVLVHIMLGIVVRIQPAPGCMGPNLQFCKLIFKKISSNIQTLLKNNKALQHCLKGYIALQVVYVFGKRKSYQHHKDHHDNDHDFLQDVAGFVTRLEYFPRHVDLCLHVSCPHNRTRKLIIMETCEFMQQMGFELSTT